MSAFQMYDNPPRPVTLWRILAIFAVGAVLIIGTMYGIASFLMRGQVKAPAPAHLDLGAAPGAFRPTKSQWASFKIAPVQSMAFSTELVTDGNIALNDAATTPVFSPYSGRVTRLIAKLGDSVTKGSPLMAVTSSEVIQGQNDLIGAAAALDTSRSQVKLAEAVEERQHQSYLAQAGALKDWLQSQADLVAAHNNLRTAQASFDAARNRLRILGLSEAEIDAITRNRDARKSAPDTQVLSPIPGTVIQRQVGIGQYVNSVAAGAPAPLYVIADLSTLWLIANVRESDAPYMRVGQPVEVRVLAYPEHVFSAKIDWIGSAVDPNTHRLPVRAEVRNPEGELKPNMFASFTIVTEKTAAAPAVPESAIVYEGNDAHVWVANQDRTVSARQIRTGRSRNGMVEVSSGLAVGEEIVTSGTLFIDRAAGGNS